MSNGFIQRFKQRGFTLIELVMVLVLLGIVAASALPKFSDLTGTAHSSANSGIGGSLASAVNIAHSAWVALGGTSAVDTVPMECATNNVHVNDTGWPDNAVACGGTPGAGTATPTAAECVAIWTNIMNNPPTAQTGACTQAQGGNCYQAAGAGTTCTYTRNVLVVAGTSIAYNIATGAVTITNP